jgi:hypothetical protein
MPRSAASFSAFYPQIRSTDIPVAASGVLNAWSGILQPFANDETARMFLRSMEDGKRVEIDEGAVFPRSSMRRHWADPLLVEMNQLCRVMILESPAPAHPRAYLLDPSYDAAFLRFNNHPHPRWDQALEIDGKLFVGLCLYSAAEFAYLPNVEKSAQFLDQVSLWVGRHLIWLKTRRLYCNTSSGRSETYVPGPGEQIGWPVGRGEYWEGIWSGPRARSTTAAQHFANIQPAHECWCGSGISYSQCHRPREQQVA